VIGGNAHLRVGEIENPVFCCAGTEDRRSSPAPKGASRDWLTRLSRQTQDHSLKPAGRNSLTDRLGATAGTRQNPKRLRLSTSRRNPDGIVGSKRLSFQEHFTTQRTPRKSTGPVRRPWPRRTELSVFETYVGSAFRPPSQTPLAALFPSPAFPCFAFDFRLGTSFELAQCVSSGFTFLRNFLKKRRLARVRLWERASHDGSRGAVAGAQRTWRGSLFTRNHRSGHDALAANTKSSITSPRLGSRMQPLSDRVGFR